MDINNTSVELEPIADNYPRIQPTTQKTFLPSAYWSRVALSWSALQLVVVFSLQLVLLLTHLNYTSTISTNLADTNFANARALTVYHGLFLAAQLFQLILSLDAIITRSIIQVISLCIFNSICFAYSIVQNSQASTIYRELQASRKIVLTNESPNQPTFPWEISVIVFMGVFSSGWFFLLNKLKPIFGWSIFINMGADKNIKKQIWIYHIFIMLLKLDWFFFVGFSIQFLVLVLERRAFEDPLINQAEVYIHGFVAIPISIILLIISYFAVLREKTTLMTMTFLGLSTGIGYLVAKLVDIFTNKTTKYVGAKNSLAWFVSTTLLMAIITFCVAILTYRNFGKGLKEKIQGQYKT